MRECQRHLAHRHGPAVHDGEPGDHDARRRGRRRFVEGGGRASGGASRRASRTVSGSGDHPAARPSSTRGGTTGEVASTRRRLTHDQRTVAGDQADPVGEGHHALQPVLGEQDRDAEVVHQPGDRRQHVLGGRRVEGRGRLVEHQQPRVHREHRADRHPLLLPAGERAQVPVTQVGDAEQVEGLLDAAPHRLRRQPELLHAVGELLLDRVGDEAGQRVLADVPDRMRPFARRRVQTPTTVEENVTPERPAGEPRHQPGHDAQQCGLPGSGRPGHQDQLALFDQQRHVVEHECVVVPERDVAQLQQRHPPTTRGSGAAATAASPSSAPTSATMVTCGNDDTSG